ncbi:MAG: DoxX family protein [Chitinophagales bacterium]|nr:DoxX family protein [Chitinophagales bacterium]
MKKGILWLLRILVGGLFIFSGLIKANDPVGFAIKLEEYFELFAEAGSVFAFFKSAFVLDSIVFLAVFICVLEVALGVCLIIGLWGRLVSWLLLLMMLFFTWLTGYSAITGKVTDCGCFGDAIPLTPWQSFYKDIVLTILILIIFAWRKHIKAVFGNVVGFGLFFAASAFTTWVCVHVLQHDVFKDFRPYAVGNNITTLMQIPENAKKAVVQMTYAYKNEVSGETKEFAVTTGLQDNLLQELNGLEEGSPAYNKLKEKLDDAIRSSKEEMDELSTYSGDTNWKFVERKDKEIEPGFKAKIIDFAVIDEKENDITQKILNYDDYMLMVVSDDLDKTNPDAWKTINDMQKAAEAEGVFTFAFVGEGRERIELFRHEVQAAYPFYKGDYKVILTIMRTNPGVVLLKKGTVLAKWSYRDVPSFIEIKNEYFPDRQKTALTFNVAENAEIFTEGEEVLSKITASEEPYNEFFIIDAESNDFTQQLLADSVPVYMMIVNDMTKVTQESYGALLPLMQKLSETQTKWFVVSKSDLKLVGQMKDAAKLEFNYYNADGDVLSKIMEENTGIVVIENGVVAKKYREGKLPDPETLIIQ